jgi:hypothetical protein
MLTAEDGCELTCERMIIKAKVARNIELICADFGSDANLNAANR